MKRIIVLLALLLTPSSLYAGTVSFDQLSASGDLTVAKWNADMDRIYIKANTNVQTDNVADDTLLESDMADEINPRIRTNEGAACEYVFTGLLPADDTDLTSDISTGTAYPRGFRVVKSSATSHTYTENRWEYVEIDQNGDFQFQVTTINAAVPAVSANSIRLARVSTDNAGGSAQINEVLDLRKTSCAAGPFEVITDRPAEASLENMFSNGSPRIQGTEGFIYGMQISYDNADLTKFYIKDGSAFVNGFYRTASADRSVPSTADDPANETDGIDTGSLAASTKYFVYAVADKDGDTNLSVSFSTSATAPTGVTNSRKIAQVRTNVNTQFTSKDMVSLNGAGKVIQSRYESTPTTRSITTTFALDTSAWSDSEGTNVISVSIDPVSVGNRILLSARAYYAETSTGVITGAAIIRGSETTALPGCVAVGNGVATTGNFLAIDCETEATVTTQETYKLFVGPATAATIYLNGGSGGQFLGNGFGTGIRATEVER